MTTLAQKIDAATDQNDHTGAVLIMADALGGPVGNAFRVILDEIADGQELVGYTVRSDIALRDAIETDLRDRLKQAGKL